MKVNSRWPMLLDVLKDIRAEVDAHDNYKGKPWWHPWGLRPALPKARLCIEIEIRLKKYGQPWRGVSGALCSVYRGALGYEHGAYPLGDAREQVSWKKGTRYGDARRKLLAETLAYVEALELGTLPPADDQVGEILP